MTRNALRWQGLSGVQRGAVARRMMASFAAGGRYDLIEGDVSRQRQPAFVELGGEDDILLPYQRHQVTNMTRQQMRNSSMARTIDQQRRVNVVGLKGGKLTLTFPKGFEDSARAWQDWFNGEWAPQAEFTDGLHFNELLKLALSSGDTSGDVTLVFDDELFCDSGRVRAFESDEHANLASNVFGTRYGKMGWRQSQGRIYDGLGRAVGVVVSTSQRGRHEFDEGKCFVLTCDPAAARADNFFVMLRRAWRFNQGRGVSPLTAAMTTLVDLHNITANETQAANLNAKLVGQLLDSSEEEEETVPEEFDPNAGTVPDTDTDGNPLSDEEKAVIAAAQAARDSEAQQPLSLEQFKAIGAMFDAMPPKLKMEMIDTKRPNPNMPQFIDWLAGSVSSVYGMGRVYATLNPEASYTAFRGAQCLSWPSIEESQKDLERTACDWAGRNAIRYALRKGLVDEKKYPLPASWWRHFVWSWPKMREVNEVDAETANEKKLSNRTINYRSLLGPNWREELVQSFDEEDFFKENGHIHPAQRVTGGSVAGAVDTKKRGSDSEKSQPQ